MSDPIFTFTSINPFGLSNVGGFAKPTFGDIDGDGDLDAYVGADDRIGGYNSTGEILFFKNTGTTDNPVFAPYSIVPFRGTFSSASYPAPTLVDIDDDGDLDVFVSYGKGTYSFYRNTGTPSNPVFADGDVKLFGKGLDVWGFARNTFGDIDGDGDLDAYVGNQKGEIIFFRNTGTASNPVFADASFDPYGLHQMLTYTHNDAPSPTLVDIDGDGDLDAFVGWKNGYIELNRNTGTSSSPEFNLDYDDSWGTFGLSNVGEWASPTFVDIDGDGDLDAFVGNQNGDILFFTNSASVGTHVPKPEDPDGKTADEIFKSVLSDNEKLVKGAEEAGMIRVMADFSKAAYHLETHEKDNVFNDEPNENADLAFREVKDQKWQPLDLNYLPHLPLERGAFSYIIHEGLLGFNGLGVSNVENGLSNGFYNHDNAAAFVARAGDAVVISFRGTNDNDENYPNDEGNKIHPDADEWGSIFDGSTGDMTEHYDLLRPLLDELDAYVATHDDIKKVYVTGHSLGGAMAIEYMENHPIKSDPTVTYSAITFAAPAFTGSNSWRNGFIDDDRITQIEISEDPVPQTWDVEVVINSFNNNRPGDVIRFAGNQTLDEPDSHDLFKARDDNHSMDYYRQIVDNVDASSWLRILDGSGDQTVFLGGKQDGDNFFVDEGADVLEDTDLDQEDFDQIGDDDIEIFYGGRGDDELTGGNSDELMLGGSGSDSIDGNGGIDTAAYSGARTNYTLQLNEILFFADQRIVTDQRTASDNEGTDTLENIERLIFTDSGVAFDLNDSGGNAGKVAKLIGAVFGAESVSKADYVAIGLYYLDTGTSYEDLAAGAISIAGANSPEEVVTLLWTNVAGSPPTPDQIQEVLKDLGKSTGKLGVYAAEYSLNQTNINLVGLVENGIVFDPLHYQPIG